MTVPSKHALYSYYDYYFLLSQLVLSRAPRGNQLLGRGGGGVGGVIIELVQNTRRKIYLFGFWFQFFQVYVTHQNYNVQIF